MSITRRDLLLGASTLPAVGLVSSPLPASAAVGVLWEGNFEDSTLFPTFGRGEYVGTIAPATVTSPVARNSHSGEFIAPPGASRCELVPLEGLSQGQVRYFGFSLLLHQIAFESASWGRVFFQCRYNGYDASPPIALHLGGRGMAGSQYFVQSGPYGSDTGNIGAPMLTELLGNSNAATIDIGRWRRWVFGVDFRSGTGSQANGWIKVWKDGVLLLGQTPWRSLYSKMDGDPWDSSLKFGIYRDFAILTKDVVYHADWRMGTTYDSVA